MPGAARTLSLDLQRKFTEQFDRMQHLVRLVPSESLGWSPLYEQAWTNRQLIEHLRECLLGVCAALSAALPRLADTFTSLRLNPPMDLAPIWTTIENAFALVEDRMLLTVVPTVFVEEGQTVHALLLNNLEHLINHKHQLFVHLRLMGVRVESRDLYQFHETN